MAVRLRKHAGRPETREDILKAARDVFSLKGYHETQIRDIIKRCGCGIGTFYQYFKNKDGIFLEIVRGGASILRGKLQAELGQARGAEETLTAGLRAFLSFVEKERPYFVALFREGYVNSPAVRAVVNESNGAVALAVRGLMRSWMDKGQIRKMSEEEVDVVTQGVIGTCMHAAALVVSGYGVPREKMIEHLTKALFVGIQRK